ncbi:hypothetical protein BY996DRAFT_6428831 [Phakopsora pachyrhizi]|uniref:Secreted protein n=1 Tax=Phakopsora pachyrhizi TaxID=170000 RepID=A0A0S1MJL5_PHAPC|nr:hypothetical protein BY996DRAFT_6428831 [Phakopsora pachyrhizi]
MALLNRIVFVLLALTFARAIESRTGVKLDSRLNTRNTQEQLTHPRVKCGRSTATQATGSTYRCRNSSNDGKKHKKVPKGYGKKEKGKYTPKGPKHESYAPKAPSKLPTGGYGGHEQEQYAPKGHSSEPYVPKGVVSSPGYS